MKILITGAAGFIGRALSEKLGAHHQVIAAVRTLPAEAFVNATPVVVGDIASFTGWAEMLQGCDVIIHLAARAHVLREAARNPLAEFRQVNVSGTLRLAKEGVDAGVGRFIFISSIGVNGNISEKPFTVFDEPRPCEPYAVSKYEAERALTKFVEGTSMQFVIIRPPLVYGPNAPGNFARLMSVLHKRWVLPLGATHNSRSFVSLGNLIDLIYTCLDHPAAANQTFLVSDGQDLSTTDLLNRMGRALGTPARLVPVPVWLLVWTASLLGKGDLAQKLCGSLQVDIEHTCKTLGWRPRVSVDETLAETAEQFLEQHVA